MPNTFDIELNTSGIGFKDGDWRGNAFEGDTLSFSLDGLTGPITVSVYAGKLDSIAPGTPTSDAFLLVGGQHSATVTVDTGTSLAQIAVGASAQGQDFTLAYTASGQTYVKTLRVNTFLGIGSTVTPPEAEVVPGALVYFENETGDAVELDVDAGGEPTSSLFGKSRFSVSSDSHKMKTVQENAPHQSYSLKQKVKKVGSPHDTGSTISIKVGTSTPDTEDVEDERPHPH